MSNLDSPEGVPQPQAALQLRLQAEEIEQLKLRISALLTQVDSLQKHERSGEMLENRMARMQEANQNLVLATFGAQDMQASAEFANRRQTEFLAMLAHELRNPLAPIAMANELLGRHLDAQPQLAQLHAIIERQVRHMARLVDDLLDASRVSSGKMRLQKRLVLLSEVIEIAVETSRPFLDKRSQRLLVELPGADVVIFGDVVRLAQAVSNLVVNASKFSPEYECIDISALAQGDSVTIAVADRGAGIAPEMLPQVFDLFVQGYRSLHRSQGGLGIGLSLVRSIVDMHGGTTWADSQGIGMGSTFRISLPVRREALPATGAVPAPIIPARSKRILLIEDNVDANDTLRLLLEEDGYSTSCAFDGPTGLDFAARLKFDVVICDIGLPGMDGYAVARQLRLHALAPQSRLIAISGYNQADDRAYALAAGFDHYLVKPLVMAELRGLLAAPLAS